MLDSAFNKKGQALMLALLLFTAISSQAANEHIHGVRSMDCSREYCIKMDSEELQKSILANIYAFGPSNFQVFRGSKSLIELKGYEGSYDPTIQRYYLSKPSEAMEYVIDLQTQEIIPYKFKK